MMFERFKGYSFEKKMLILFFILSVVSISFITGFIYGQINAIGLFTKLAFKVLELTNTNISVDQSQIADGLFRYANNIGGPV